MYFFNINPVNTNYNWISDNYIDYILINNTPNVKNYKYVRDSIKLYKYFNKDIIKYIITNLYKKTNINLDFITDSYINDLVNLSKVIYSNSNNIDKDVLYTITLEFYNKIINNIYNFTNKYDEFEFLDSVFEPYTKIKNFNKRIIYYAYTVNEVLYFKEKFNAPVVWLEMNHVIRSNVLASSNKIDKLDLLNNEEYNKEMQKIKAISTHTINNNYDFKVDIANKIKSVINF